MHFKIPEHSLNQILDVGLVPSVLKANILTSHQPKNNLEKFLSLFINLCSVQSKVEWENTQSNALCNDSKIMKLIRNYQELALFGGHGFTASFFYYFKKYKNNFREDVFGKRDICIAMDFTVLENTRFIDILVFHIEAEEATSYSPVNISLKSLLN